MATLDIFNSNAFSMSALTNAIETAPYAPKMLGALKLFKPMPIRTTVAWIEKKKGRLRVIHTANRGTMRDVRSSMPRTAVPIEVPHVPYFQTILADDVQNIRAFGQESELESVIDRVNEELEGMKKDHEATWEYHRIGALKGIVLDADGVTPIVNLYTKFGLSQTVVNWWQNDASFAPHVTSVIRLVANKLGADTFTGIVAICGDNYFDQVVQHASMQAAYDRWREGEFKRVSHLGPEWYAAAANGFGFQNVLFINYRGQIDDLTYIESNSAYYVPLGVDDLFEEIIAPGDMMDTVNTKGRRIYVSKKIMDHNKGVELHTQSNVLMLNKRPDIIVKSNFNSGTNSSSSSA